MLGAGGPLDLSSRGPTTAHARGGGGQSITSNGTSRLVSHARAQEAVRAAGCYTHLSTNVGNVDR